MTNALRLHVRAFAASADAECAAALQAVPAMLRRRLSAAGRHAMAVALGLTGVADAALELPQVHCSRHGEVERCIELINQLNRGETLSPMTFSLSVHNAVAGLLSIQQSNRAASVALAAAAETAHAGLLEAAALLAEGADQVLWLVYDGPLPDLLSSRAAGPRQAFAFGALLKRVADADCQTFTLELCAGQDACAQTPASAREPTTWQHLFPQAGGAAALAYDAGPYRWVLQREACHAPA